MFVARKGTSSACRRVEQFRHGQHLIRSLKSTYSSIESSSGRNGVRCMGSSRLLEQLVAHKDLDEKKEWSASTWKQLPSYSLRYMSSSKDSSKSSPETLAERSSSWNLVHSAIPSSGGYRGIVVNASDASGRSNRYRYFSTEQQPQSPPKEKKKPRGTYSTHAKIPTPKSSLSTSLNPLASIDFTALAKSTADTTWSMTKTIFWFLVRLPGNIFYFSTNPAARKEKIQEIKDAIRKEVDHYWSGAKLLMADVRTARRLLAKTLSGNALTRRERKQLLRTVSDLFRLVPFSMFVLIPFMEFALPFALRLFPNMLPSTFQDSLKAEETMKRELQTRIAMAQFFQETLEDLAKEQKRIVAKRDDEIATKQEESAASLLQFLDRARSGEMIPPDIIVQYANYFQDDLTLDNMPRMQLINMCKYMSIPPYGADSFLRFQLRHKIRILKEDDQRILWEGIDSLTKMELREACQERGMRSTGMSNEAYKKSLQQWLDLSVNKNVPISLLIMSRIFFLQEEIVTPSASDSSKSVAGLADAISGLDKEVLNEVILEVATSEEIKSDPDVRKIKLEVLAHQNEMIREEAAQRREAAEKKKKIIDEGVLDEPLASVVADLPPDAAQKLSEAIDVAASKEYESVLFKVKMGDGKTGDGEVQEGGDQEKKKESIFEKELSELSAAEMEAISQLLSADPVSKEREDLAKIKSAMQDRQEDETKEELESDSSNESDEKEALTNETASPTASDEKDYDDKYAQSVVEEATKNASAEADASTSFTTESELPPTSKEIENEGGQGESGQVESEQEEEATQPEEIEDPVVARLKKRLASMVDKIEVQLSDVQVKIGDKLHFLDKDMDGILSKEEMANCLQQVLKRNVTFEEAMEIADAVDENKDGVFTVQELISWIETNKLVQFQSEGRDADMDKIMENQSSENQKEESEEPKDGQSKRSKKTS